MRNFIIGVIALLSVSLTQAAPVMIDGSVGLSGSFSFGGTPGTTQTSPVDGWMITVVSDSLIDVSVFDCCVIGDEFALLLDGVEVPWTDSNPGDSSLFFGEATDLFLSAGTHTFDFLLTEACCSSGGGSYSFSAVSDAPASVTEPAILSLFSLGLAGLGFARRR